MTNPQQPAKLFAYRSYRAAPAAIAWLEKLGFETIARQDAADGNVTHCELKFGEVVVMLASRDADYDVAELVGNSTGQGLYLRTDAVDHLYEAAVAAGGTAVFAPEDTEWGTRRARVLDPEGYEWSFGSYEPGGSW